MKPINKILTLLIITIIVLSGCHFPGTPWVLVEITSHEDGQAVALNQDVRIITQARSSQGIEKVELYINGELEHVDEPPLGQPLEFFSDQPWVPVTEGQVIISVIATDRRGNVSEPFSITLQMVASLDDIDTESTPTPTVSPEELAQTQTAQASCTNSASFVEHVTIPNNAFVAANSNFTKIWRVNNNGTCDWVGYQVVHSSGDLMSATSPKALPVVNAGSNADIVVDMVAPSTPGPHTAVWRIQAGDGTLFGPELPITINVPEQPTNTPVPTATNTATPTVTLTPTPTRTATPTSLPLSVQQYSEQISIPPNSTENKTVNCPAGSVVVSGGYAHQLGIRAWHSVKDGNGWRIYATNTLGSARTLTVTATCLFNSGGTSDLTLTQENISANDVTQLTANCPSGSLVTGGGWVIGNNNPLKVLHASKSGNSWQIDVENPSGNTPLVNVYAICLSGVPGSTAQEASLDEIVSPTGTTNVSELCPTGSYVTGGGFTIDSDLVLYNTSKYQNGWINYVSNATGVEKRMDTYAICYTP